MWPHRDSGTCTPWMPPLLAAPLDQTWGIITKYLNLISTQYIPRAEYTQLNIVYNVLYPSLHMHIRDKLSQNTLLMLTQEVKQDIIFRRMNLPPSASLPSRPQRLAAHLNSTFTRLHHSYLQYIGLAKYPNATKMLQEMMAINLEDHWEGQFGTSPLFPSPLPRPFISWNCDTKILTHANTVTPDTYAHSATHSYTTLSMSTRVHQYVQS